jgi:hypothetical protein
VKFLVRAIRQEQEIKGIEIGKEEVKLSLYAEDMILYQKDKENCTKTLLDIITTFSKGAGYKINLQNSKPFYIPTMNRLKKNIGEQLHLQYPQKY